jgi:hypothetical protein
MLRRTWIALVSLAGLLAAGIGAQPAPAVQVPALQAQVVDISRPVAIKSYSTVDYGKKTVATDDKKGSTTWRVVQGTGNCCENYLTTTSGGRLLDFGGSFINYSDDRGVTWKQVRPLNPLVNGEGTLDLAPNGDVIAIGWDPYSGDHLQAFKYEANSGNWYYQEQPLHSPFYDREWVTVVPGPFSIDGRTYPYLSFLKGGYPSKEDWLYSTDGIEYTNVTSKYVDDTLSSETQSYLTTHADSTFDWIQANSSTGLTALGAGGALASGDWPFDAWSLLHPSTLTWTAFEFPGPVVPQGSFQVDSAGRIQNLVPHGDGAGFDYRTSTDGGKSWRSATVALPAKYTIDQIDFRANRAAGVAAVVVHALNSDTGNDQDYVYKFDIATSQPFLKRMYLVGLGDAGSAAGVGNSVRMDFQTVSIFNDGRVALSFLDSTTHYPSPTTGQAQPRPALAIEQNTALR